MCVGNSAVANEVAVEGVFSPGPEGYTDPRSAVPGVNAASAGATPSDSELTAEPFPVSRRRGTARPAVAVLFAGLLCGWWSVSFRTHNDTDVSPLETIVAWVEECFDRLAQSAAQTVVAELPVCNFPLVSERRFRLFRRLLFPRCSLSRAELLRRGEKLNEQVKKLAAARNFFLVAPRAEWYGLDPIHVRRPMRCRAWLELLSRWRPDASIGAAPSASPLVWLYLRTRLPADYRRFGAERQRRQPSGRLQGGARLSVY